VAEVLLDHVWKKLDAAEAEVVEAMNEARVTHPHFVAAFEEGGAAHRAISTQARRARPKVEELLLAWGWFPGPWLTDPVVVELDELFRVEGDVRADARMVAVARDQLARIRVEAGETFPDRAHILAEAFDAHEAGKYALSIPALLAQADGIGCEVLGHGRQFYSQKQRGQGLTDKSKAFVLPGLAHQFPPESSYGSLLTALRERWTITADTDERADESTGRMLNRHGVLHGVDPDYATEANSHRCVLLLGFLLEVGRILGEAIPHQFESMRRFLAEKLGDEFPELRGRGEPPGSGRV
jgi:hypothetical protein